MTSLHRLLISFGGVFGCKMADEVKKELPEGMETRGIEPELLNSESLILFKKLSEVMFGMQQNMDCRFGEMNS